MNWIEAPEIAPARLGILLRSTVDLGAEAVRDECVRNDVDVVVSVLSEFEVVDLELEHVATSLSAVGVEFYWHPVMDRGVPTDDGQTKLLSQVLRRCIVDGKSVAIHCHYGLGRSPLAACVALIDHGFTAAQAIQRVSAARETSVPETDRQKLWLSMYEQSRNA